MSRVKNLIFDLDGTLIDSSDGVVEAVNYSLKMMGEPLQPPEIIKPYIGYPLSQMYHDFTDKPLKELYHHFQVKAAETVVKSTYLLPGVKETIEILHKQNFKMAIATTKIKKHVHGISEMFDWSDKFHAFVGGDEVKQVKPAPDVFMEAMKRLKVKSEDSIVIGDTVNDIFAAQAIPIKVIAVKSPYGGHEKIKAAKPDYHINSITELPDLLRKI